MYNIAPFSHQYSWDVPTPRSPGPRDIDNDQVITSSPVYHTGMVAFVAHIRDSHKILDDLALINSYPLKFLNISLPLYRTPPLLIHHWSGVCCETP
jgi:hypothetical protein